MKSRESRKLDHIRYALCVGMGLALPAFLTFICFIIACQASAVMRWT